MDSNALLHISHKKRLPKHFWAKNSAPSINKNLLKRMSSVPFISYDSVSFYPILTWLFDIPFLIHNKTTLHNLNNIWKTNTFTITTHALDYLMFWSWQELQENAACFTVTMICNTACQMQLLVPWLISGTNWLEEIYFTSFITELDK